ncbi:MAG: biotin--[acetyl-CoA-carboxylase] ligase [Tepidiformaceae bacterium]
MAPFDAARFDAALKTAALCRALIYRPLVETTMTIAREQAAASAAHGTLVLAEQQTAGRGRRGRSFWSPSGGNLYFTFVLRTSLEVHRLLPLSVPLAVVRACRAEGVDARIKWPNDVWLDGAKLGGILIDADLAPGGPVAFPGIGLNVNTDPTERPELARIATSFRKALGRDVDRELLLARICGELEECLAWPSQQTSEHYRALSIVLGRPVTISPALGAAFEATATGIADDGALLIERQRGREEKIFAADVSVSPTE